jgi:hypothetical protein
MVVNAAIRLDHADLARNGHTARAVEEVETLPGFGKRV